ncbi:hypothetical protein VTO42DRAFT_8872 [Malbranchea cinnamomea]
MTRSLQVRSFSAVHGLPATCRSALRTTGPLVQHSRYYATQSSLGNSSNPSPRKQITITSDDGRVRWGELSTREKAARATQQTVNFAVILVGAIMTAGVFTFLYKDVFAPDSKTRQFNRAVDRIKEDSRCIALLGDSKKIRAYGENTWNRWTRNRPVATTISTDKQGREHMKMHFYVSGPLNEGVVNVHLIKPSGQHEYQYHLLALDVKGHTRVYLENAEAAARAERKKSTIFGIRWN